MALKVKTSSFNVKRSHPRQGQGEPKDACTKKGRRMLRDAQKFSYPRFCTQTPALRTTGGTTVFISFRTISLLRVKVTLITEDTTAKDSMTGLMKEKLIIIILSVIINRAVCERVIARPIILFLNYARRTLIAHKFLNT